MLKSGGRRRGGGEEERRGGGGREKRQNNGHEGEWCRKDLRCVFRHLLCVCVCVCVRARARAPALRLQTSAKFGAFYSLGSLIAPPPPARPLSSCSPVT